MKKPVALALAAAVVALAYPASAWFLGRHLETKLNELYHSLDEHPYIKLVSRDYQRGLFSSTETATLELTGLSKPSAANSQENAQTEASDKAQFFPIRITLRTNIQHGPLPGFSTLAAAVADSKLLLSAEQQQLLGALPGDQKPLQAHTVFNFLGGGKSTLSSPAFAFDLPKNAEGKNAHANWNGLQMSVDFSRHMKHYIVQANAPSLEISNDTGSLAKFTGLHLATEQNRLFDDLPGFYAGSSKITLEQLSIVGNKEATTETEETPKQTLLLKQLSYDASIPVNGEFINLIGKLGVETAQLGERNYGPAHYDFSLHHLHARSTATLYQALLKWYADPARQAVKGTASQFEGIDALREPAFALLTYSPEFHLKRISFKSPQGEAKISANAKLGPVQADELANPFILIGKLDVDADLTLPEDLLNDTLRPDLITAFIDRGYFTRNGNMLLSKIAFAKGRVTINGQSFNPMAMGGK